MITSCPRCPHPLHVGVCGRLTPRPSSPVLAVLHPELIEAPACTCAASAQPGALRESPPYVEVFDDTAPWIRKLISATIAFAADVGRNHPNISQVGLYMCACFSGAANELEFYK